MGDIIKAQTSELFWLIREVETKMGKPLTTPSDFNQLLIKLRKETSKTLAMSTVKRLWNYVGDRHTPSLTTLDVLATFVGFNSWKDFCAKLATDHKVESEVFSSFQVNSADLNMGDQVLLAWMPDRECKLRYLGDNRYEVLQAANAKILQGDTFSALSFHHGYPLYVTSLSRGGKELGNYVAGSAAGLTFLKVEQSGEKGK